MFLYLIYNFSMTEIPVSKNPPCPADYYTSMLRKMLKKGYIRKDGKFLKQKPKKANKNASCSDNEEVEYRFLYTNLQVQQICKTDIDEFIMQQKTKYLAHLARQSSCCISKKLLFNADRYTKCGNHTDTLEESVLKHHMIDADQFYRQAIRREF